MSLETQLSTDIAAAMKAKDTVRLGTFRMLKTALTNKSIEKGRTLEPAEELQVVAALVKQRRDSIEQFTTGNRPDLAAKEQAEIASSRRFCRRRLPQRTSRRPSNGRWSRPVPPVRKTWAG
jgi:uncharacterized protein YqeY